ncbi:MAG: hypothetical protein JRJ26_09730 [Deltaproteobacteria bacterium]|nr:hypothetical protein [Deltaproteobacteria bacterium]
MPRARVLQQKLKEVKTLGDMLDFLNLLIADLYSGKLPAKQGQAIVSALSGIKSTIEAMPTPVEDGIGLKLYDVQIDEFYDQLPPLPAPGEKGDAGSVEEKPKALVVGSEDKSDEGSTNPLPDKKVSSDGLSAPQKEKKKGEGRPEPESGKPSVIVTDFARRDYCDSEEFWDYLEERAMGNDF